MPNGFPINYGPEIFNYSPTSLEGDLGLAASEDKLSKPWRKRRAVPCIYNDTYLELKPSGQHAM
jgi:hypothetical protein